MPESMSSLSLIRPTRTRNDTFAFHFAFGCLNPMTRVPFELLGPCYKTGQITNVNHWWRTAHPLHRDARRREEWTTPQIQQAHSVNAIHSCHTAKRRRQQSPACNLALGTDWCTPIPQQHSFSMIECALVHRSSNYAPPPAFGWIDSSHWRRRNAEFTVDRHTT